MNQFGTDGLSGIILGDMSPKLINEGDWKLGLYQGWYTREMFNKDLELIHTDYKRFALMVAEGLLFKNYPENVRDFQGRQRKSEREFLIKKRFDCAGFNPGNGGYWRGTCESKLLLLGNDGRFGFQGCFVQNRCSDNYFICGPGIRLLSGHCGIYGVTDSRGSSDTDIWMYTYGDGRESGAVAWLYRRVCL